MAAKFKKGQAVKVKSARSGTIRVGKFVATHPTAKGDYIEIMPDDSKVTFKARPSQVSAA